MSDNPHAALPFNPAHHERPAHATFGSPNANTGAGVQRNYIQSGGSNNRQFNADTINYTERAKTPPDFTGTYSYTSTTPVAGYVARPELQKQVEDRLRDARVADAARTSILVLVGLGGAGKTQLALHYIKTHRKDYSAVFWVDARRQESVERDFVQTYCLLLDINVEQNLAASRIDTDRAVTAVKTRSHSRKGRWLFVFDNADSLDDSNDPYYVDLQHYLPDAACVDVIVTTRSQTAIGMTELEAVKVAELAPAEASDIFVQCSKLRDPTEEELAEIALIVEELGYLVLAVTLAGAYVAATRRIYSNIKEYLPEYRRRRKTLLGRKATQQVNRYGESVLCTWETSCAAIAGQCPAAVRLLSFFAFLDPRDIFLELFYPKPDSLITRSDSQESEWKDFLSSDRPFEEALDEALEALSTYCLIEWKEEQDGYSMHKLVHAWGFERLETEEQGEYSAKSLVFLEWVTHGRQLHPVAKSRVAPHISSSTARLQEWRRTSVAVPLRSLNLLWSLANFVGDTGQFDAEFELRSLEQAEREVVKEKDETRWLQSLNDLAKVLWKQGKYEAAEEMDRRALEGMEKVLGKDHPYTLVSLNNLVPILNYQGKYKAAEEISRRALEGSEKVLGKEHTITLTSVNNLALVLRDQGKYEATEEMHRQALEIYEKVVGKEHPDTLTSVNNFAGVLQDQGKYEAAEKIYRRVLERREKVLGEEHPVTLTSVNNFAGVLQDQGKYEAAEKIYRRVLERREKVLGKEHPDTLTSMNNFAGVLYYQGNNELAEEIYRRCLEIYKKVLGKEHPDTLISVNNLASVLKDQGKRETAVEMYRRVLGGSEKVLGKKHPLTLTSANHLVSVLRAQGKYEAAEEDDQEENERTDRTRKRARRRR